jgi:hypothetical protein
MTHDLQPKTSPCCNAEVFLDWFSHPRKPMEYLIRCSACHQPYAVAQSEEQSVQQWNNTALDAK